MMKRKLWCKKNWLRCSWWKFPELRKEPRKWILGDKSRNNGDKNGKS